LLALALHAEQGSLGGITLGSLRLGGLYLGLQVGKGCGGLGALLFQVGDILRRRA
jgi:hypothetical protein